MKILKGIVATGHMDSQGEVLMPPALYGMADRANEKYIPVWVQHDVSIPPIGRYLNAQVITLPDGVLAVETTAEIWETAADLQSIRSDGRRMVIHEVDSPTFEVGFDLTFHDEAGMAIVRELEQIGAAKIQYEARKSAEVVSQISIAAGTFIAGTIFIGFLNALGEAMLNALKERLKRVRQEKDASGNERASRIVFQFTVTEKDRKIEVNAVLDNATDKQIDQFFEDGMKQLDKITKDALEIEPRTARIAARQTETELEPLYLVRDDCAPVLLQRADGDAPDRDRL